MLCDWVMGDLEKLVFQTEFHLLESDSLALTGKKNQAPALFKLGLVGFTCNISPDFAAF